MGLEFREEVDMATLTLRTHQKQSTNRDTRARVFGVPQSDCAVAPNTDGGGSLGEGSKPLRVSFARHVERLPRTARGLGRRIARFILTAGLTLIVLAGTVALQAAIHVYVWHLAG
jgi:hypothetical protein